MGASGADVAEAPDTGDSSSSACTGAGWVGPARFETVSSLISAVGLSAVTGEAAGA